MMHANDHTPFQTLNLRRNRYREKARHKKIEDRYQDIAQTCFATYIPTNDQHWNRRWTDNSKMYSIRLFIVKPSVSWTVGVWSVN